MGFRDLALFNQAMLAKQGWRLLTDPTSLCARVLKGRYFPVTDFWNAPKPRTSSFTWRSILHGRELLKQGIQWGISNGNSVKILGDNWVPSYPPGILKTASPIPESATVNCLIDEASGSWNLENVQAFFDASAAEKIMQIPILRHAEEDFVRWPFTRLGVFTVRSAYNLARSTKFFKSHAVNSNSAASEKDWKTIWSIKAPGKMKIHLWRFAHNCLPSGVQPVRRRIPADGTCCFCGRSESIEHAMLFCQFARTVWQRIKLSVPLKLNRKFFSSCKQWLFDFLARSSELQATMLTVGFWHIWEARNDKRNSEVKPCPVRSSGKSLAYVDLIRDNLFSSEPKHRRDSSSVSQWSPPPQGSVLVNSDAAIFEAAGCMGVGVVIRDHRGGFLAACREHFDSLATPEHAEALALRSVVIFARDEGYDKVVFVSDCLSLVQRLNSPEFDRSTVGTLVANIKQLVASFSSTSFCHVKRSLNEAAHFLAKSSSVFSTCVFHSVPDCIRGTCCINVV